MSAYESAVVLVDYEAKGPDEISLTKGEKVMVRAFNNNAKTAQGENEKGALGWFPEDVIQVVGQQVNAFDFILSGAAAAAPKPTTPRIDTSSLVDRKKQNSERLSTFLTAKPPKKILVDRNILQQGYASEEFKVAQEQLAKEKESKRVKLEKFFHEKVEANKSAKSKKGGADLSEKQMDALILLMLDIKLETHKHKLSFSGEVMQKWLMENKYADNKGDSQALAQTLLTRLVICDIADRTNTKFSSKNFYNLSCRNVEYSVMNLDKVWGNEDPGDPMVLSVDLLTLLMKYIHQKKYDFPSMRGDPEFVKVSLKLASLQKCSLDSLTYGSKEAFWLNMFNIMVLYVYCRLCPPNTKADRQLIFDKCYFNIAKSHFTITEVRDFIILGSNTFPAKDKRFAMAIGEKDKKRRALFLFGLPDGTDSTGGFYVFQPHNLEAKLKESAMVFLDSVGIDENDLKVTCPRLIRQFRSFGIKDEEVIEMLPDWLLPSKGKILKDQPGFELVVDMASSQEVLFSFDSSVVGED